MTQEEIDDLRVKSNRIREEGSELSKEAQRLMDIAKVEQFKLDSLPVKRGKVKCDLFKQVYYDDRNISKEECLADLKLTFTKGDVVFGYVEDDVYECIIWARDAESAYRENLIDESYVTDIEDV